ncbi:DUF4366 domain-containing protein [Agathobaculum sp. TL06]
MIKRKMRLLTGLLAVMLCCAALTPAAFAYADDPETAETAGTVQETDTPEDDAPVTGGAEPLTPEGNLTLVDDIQGEAAGDKQFITVQTKAGNTFYIIIDRAADGENTVYFLNAVDEADLTALMEDGEPAVCDCTTKCAAGAVDTACPVCAVNMTECVGPEPEPEPEPTPEPVEEPAEESVGLNPAVLLVVLLVLGGGGAFAYFKLVKGRKASTKGPDDLDDYDYGEDDEEYEDSLADDEDEDGEGKST